MGDIEAMGGAVSAIESGFMQDQIADTAYRWEQAIDSGERIIVGVNYQREEDESGVPLHHIDQDLVKRQIERTWLYKEDHASVELDIALRRVGAAARSTTNLLPVMREALLVGATLGQICDVLRREWGEYRPG